MKKIKKKGAANKKHNSFRIFGSVQVEGGKRNDVCTSRNLFLVLLAPHTCAGETDVLSITIDFNL